MRPNWVIYPTRDYLLMAGEPGHGEMSFKCIVCYVFNILLSPLSKVWSTAGWRRTVFWGFHAIAFPLADIAQNGAACNDICSKGRLRKILLSIWSYMVLSTLQARTYRDKSLSHKIQWHSYVYSHWTYRGLFFRVWWWAEPGYPVNVSANRYWWLHTV